jgi:hypothetical protein
MLSPHPGPGLPHHAADGAGRPGCLREVGDHPPERRVRTNITQHAFGGLQHPEVGAAIPAGVQHQQAVDQQTAPVNDRDPRPRIGHRAGESAGQTEAVGVLGERPQATQRDDLVGLIAAVIAHRFRRAMLHLTGCVPSQPPCVSQHPQVCWNGAHLSRPNLILHGLSVPDRGGAGPRNEQVSDSAPQRDPRRRRRRRTSARARSSPSCVGALDGASTVMATPWSQQTSPGAARNEGRCSSVALSERPTVGHGQWGAG